MAQPCRLGTVATTIWSPVLASRAASYWVRAAWVSAGSTWATSATRPVRAGNCGSARAGRVETNSRLRASTAARAMLARCPVMLRFGRGRGGCGSVEADRGRVLRARRRREQRHGHGTGIEGAGPGRGREPAQGGVVVLDRLIDVVARHGDAMLGAFQLVRQAHEGRVGLQVGIALLHHEQAAERGAQGPLRLVVFGQLGGVRDLGRVDLDAGGAGAGRGHADQHALLLRGGALHRVDQVRHQVGAALVFVLDVGPARLGGLFLGRDGVDAATGQAGGHGDGREGERDAFSDGIHRAFTSDGSQHLSMRSSERYGAASASGASLIGLPSCFSQRATTAEATELPTTLVPERPMSSRWSTAMIRAMPASGSLK